MEIGLTGIRRDIGGPVETDACRQARVDRLRDEMIRFGSGARMISGGRNIGRARRRPRPTLPGAAIDGLPVGLSIVRGRGSDASLVVAAQVMAAAR
jgi:hypothetical protein